MIKIGKIIVTGLISVLSTQIFADTNDQKLINAAIKNKVTVAQAIKAKDETAVTLTGKITRHIKSDHYEFKDSTGTINVEIDDDLATPSQLKPSTKVRIMGEVDTHRYKPTDIDVAKIEILR
ncbi:NirD/YgiW/YdeI family stress tolerance protein [Acinetobacter radioresistens]|uniref:NirD/YgiW/YdeI family stress tolerance protein n=1 Tax=Acinetobacter radioresistens TaxID=40216 RepID=UPI00321325EF